MKLSKIYLLLFFVLSGLVFISCSNDDTDPIDEVNDEYLLSQLDITYTDEVRRPLFKMSYDANGDISSATHYFIDAEELVVLATTTYEFVRNGNKITVNCSLTNHVEDNKVSSWVTTLTTNIGTIISAENVENNGETISYTWSGDKLQNVSGYDFTYKGKNVESAVEKHGSSFEDYYSESSCFFELICDAEKSNPFTLIPQELLAVIGDSADVLVLYLCDNEVKQLVHTDGNISKIISEDSLFYEETDTVTSAYTYTYDSNNMATKVFVEDTRHYKRKDYEEPENDRDEITDGGSYTLSFEYMKKNK